MKLKFDPNQEYQLEAINSVIGLFEGVPRNAQIFAVPIASTPGQGIFSEETYEEYGRGNNLSLDEKALLKNLHQVQQKNDIEKIDTLQVDAKLGFPNYSVEMETGTGKTYVYLRTIFELNKQYGYSKFVIVVPGKAIREGTLKNLEITKEHFKNLYGNTPFSYAVYDSKKPNIVRDFAKNNELQILLINIEAFRKDFDKAEALDEEKGVLFHRPSEKLQGASPREFIQKVRPIVIIDEPQSVGVDSPTSDIARQAIRSINPLCTLRYSATHRDVHNLIYRLDPVKAYVMRLVKKIAVASVQGDGGFNDAYVRLIDVDNKKGIKAKIEIDIQRANGPQRKKITVKHGEDLFKKSKDRQSYKDGYMVSEISAEEGNEFISFSPSGVTVRLGEALGPAQDEIKKLQIRNTIREHLDKELQVTKKGVKVLSLFFIDRVANYRAYGDDGSPKNGKFAEWFEEIYTELIQDSKYKDLKHPNASLAHDGYFAEDKSGKWKDTKGNTEADDSAYNKIMKNKEQLLSFEEPLKFIFSHSALREGWDNPNVFQICTLNETNKEIKKRQEIGRGLRLPVNQDGERIFDESINKLVVVANESYEDFAGKLQTEYQEDCGITFGVIPENAYAEIVFSKDGEDVEVGIEGSKKILGSMRENGYVNDQGKLLPAFDPANPEFSFVVHPEFEHIKDAILERTSQFELRRHITKHSSPRRVKLNKRIYLDPEFQVLWDKISPKTSYAVNYSTEELVKSSVKAVHEMERVVPVRVKYIKAEIDVNDLGVASKEVRNQVIDLDGVQRLPDILGHLQRATKLRRHTIANILSESERLDDFKVNPQKFMDLVAECIQKQLNKLIVEGITYERIDGEEYEMRLFEESADFISYLDKLHETQKSVYDAIEFDSEIERKFAEELDRKEYIKMFVKLPRWFVIDTPIGTYNPDWAIVKHNDEKLYFVRETKGVVDFEKLRNSEAFKIRCGRKHFEAIGVDYEVVTNAKEI